jgi:hypothetical protein
MVARQDSDIHRERLVSNLSELSENLAALDSKMKTYRKWLKTPKTSSTKVKK